MFESRLAREKWNELNEACDNAPVGIPCQTTDFDVWFPEDGQHDRTRAAKKFCGQCPVQALCLEYALLNNEQSGIWGGTSPRERREMRLKRKIRA
jgi:WhiB family redox-sensing transcriptional regulator